MTSICGLHISWRRRGLGLVWLALPRVLDDGRNTLEVYGIDRHHGPRKTSLICRLADASARFALVWLGLESGSLARPSAGIFSNKIHTEHLQSTHADVKEEAAQDKAQAPNDGEPRSEIQHSSN